MSVPPNIKAKITVAYDQYLVSGIVAWIQDNEYSPHVIVATQHPDVRLPPQCMTKPTERVNMSSVATSKQIWGETSVSFNARFSGRDFHVVIPYRAMVCLIFGNSDTIAYLPWANGTTAEHTTVKDVATLPETIPDTVSPDSKQNPPNSNVRHVEFGRKDKGFDPDNT